MEKWLTMYSKEFQGTPKYELSKFRSIITLQVGHLSQQNCPKKGKVAQNLQQLIIMCSRARIINFGSILRIMVGELKQQSCLKDEKWLKIYSQ
jgi:hypothetical protein